MIVNITVGLWSAVIQLSKNVFLIDLKAFPKEGCGKATRNTAIL